MCHNAKTESGCETDYKLIENEEFGYCSLIKATKNVLDKLKIENVTFAKVTSTTRIEKHLIDPVALREAAINAIVYNDFTLWGSDDAYS